MTKNAWQTGAPPNEQVVEVEWNGFIIRVRSIYGRDGTLPHWESEDRDTLWTPNAFDRWRVPSPPTGEESPHEVREKAD